jgi:hypothetical protein
MSTPVDEAKLEEFMGRMAGHMTGAALCFSIWLGTSSVCTAPWTRPDP